MASMTPDFWKNLMFWKRKSAPLEAPLNESNKWELAVNEFKNVIVWDNPVKSLSYLVCVNVLFWFLIYIKPQFYGLIFLGLLVLSLNQLWNEYFQSSVTVIHTVSGRESVASSSSSSDSRSSSATETKRYLNGCFDMVRNACLKLKRLREEQPGTFCIVTCISFLMLSFIGRTISGVTLIYTSVMAIMIVPGVIIHLLPSQFLNSFVQFVYSSHKEAESDKDEEDYLPDANKENLELLRLASDIQINSKDDEESVKDFLTNDSSESSFSKLYPELNMPSMDNSLDFLELNLNPEKDPNCKKEDSDNSDNSDINFESKHFKGDSSSEEEFASGLNFKRAEKEKKVEVTERLPNLLSAASVGLNLLSAGANILTSTVKFPPVAEHKKRERESSSDTDSFELISEEDM